MNSITNHQTLSGEEVVRALVALNEDVTAERITEIQQRVYAAGLLAGGSEAVLIGAVDAARHGPEHMDTTRKVEVMVDQLRKAAIDRPMVHCVGIDGRMDSTQDTVRVVLIRSGRARIGVLVDSVENKGVSVSNAPQAFMSAVASEKWPTTPINDIDWILRDRRGDFFRLAPSADDASFSAVDARRVFESYGLDLDALGLKQSLRWAGIAEVVDPASRGYVSRDYASRYATRHGAASDAEKETMTYALQAYGFLVERNERITLDVFADRIARHYDVSDPRTAEIVRTVRQVASYYLPVVDEAAQTREKTFEVGGVAFAAVRTMLPRPHWRLRVQESGELYEAGMGGISTESVPKMQADVEELFRRVSNGDQVDFRACFNLPEPGASADLLALATAFQAVYYTGKRSPGSTSDLDACWGKDAVDAIARHREGGVARVSGTSRAEEGVLADTLQRIQKALEGGEPYRAQALRGAEFKAAHTAAKRFAPDWKKCVAPYEARYTQLQQNASHDMSM